VYVEINQAWPPMVPITWGMSITPTVTPSRGEVILRTLLGLGLAIGGCMFIDALLTPEHRPRARRPNYAPIESWKREYVSIRDGWRCSYCEQRVTRSSRHVDHSISRANRGTNHLNNLRLACRVCNLSKGSLNARQFVTRIR